MNKKESFVLIAVNRQASHNFEMEKSLEVGLALCGWEVKSIRQGRMQLKSSYVLVRDGECWLVGAHISPLINIGTPCDAVRDRKILLHKKEIAGIEARKRTKGFAVVPWKAYWKYNKIKLQIWLALGKKDYDKRRALKEKEVKRQLLRTKY